MTREEAKHIVDVAFDVPQAVRRAGEDRTYHEDEIREAKNMAIKALEQEPCKCWYDVPSDEMTIEQARQAIKDLRKKLVEHLEQEPCEDCISRDAVLDACSQSINILDAMSRIEDLPSVTPMQRTGHWIKDDITERSKSEYKHKCDRCGAYHRAMYDYCPSCGAKLEEQG